jgi:hypothetical protein
LITRGVEYPRDGTAGSVTSKSEAEDAIYDDPPDDPDGTPHGEHLLNGEYLFSTSTVHYDSEADSLHATMKRAIDADSPEKAEHSRVLGVDCNVDAHIAVTSTGAFVGDADYVNHQRREFEKRRASLQQTGTRSAHLPFHRIGDRFGRRSDGYLHQCSQEIVTEGPPTWLYAHRVRGPGADPRASQRRQKVPTVGVP